MTVLRHVDLVFGAVNCFESNQTVYERALLIFRLSYNMRTDLCHMVRQSQNIRICCNAQLVVLIISHRQNTEVSGHRIATLDIPRFRHVSKLWEETCFPYLDGGCVPDVRC
jgi:hypothetical protein